MFREKFSDISKESKFRRSISIILYISFMIWIVFSDSKNNNIKRGKSMTENFIPSSFSPANTISDVK